jgi:hypothetical protein
MSFASSLREKRKNDIFNEWLDKNIEPNKTNKEIVYEMIGEISLMLDDYGYKIKDRKQFKNEIASYIYSEST